MGSNINTIFAQRLLVRKCVDLIKKSGVCPETPKEDWQDIVEQAHKRGYLYVSFEKDELAAVACAFRVEKITDNVGDEAPDVEKGPILYVSFAASKANSRTKLLRMLKSYIRSNSNINTVAFHDRGNERDLRVYKLFGGRHV